MSQLKTFTPEFKREAVQLLANGSRLVSQITREPGIKRNLFCPKDTEHYQF
ncbi:MAG: hypothetical protein GKS05_03150 [Nitrospirales bacterium]|nr:hypothetical protein [Nitrospirales bacterium]